MPVLFIVDRVIACLECELKIVEMELAHPERFSRPEPAKPLAKWNGSISDLLELYIPANINGNLQKPTGDPMAYSDVVAFIEASFGLKITKPYDRKTKLFSRKKNDTPYMDKLKRVFLAEVEKSNL